MKYIEIPIKVVEDINLSSTNKIVMGLIITLSMKDGYCFASNRYLSEMIKVTKRTISNSLSALRNNNYIKYRIENNQRKIYLANNFYGK